MISDFGKLNRNVVDEFIMFDASSHQFTLPRRIYGRNKTMLWQNEIN